MPQELANDPRHAGELLADAEQIEDEQSRAMSNAVEQEALFGRPTDFDLSSESLALLRVSSRPSDMGAIYAMNASATKIFGYTRLVGHA